MSLTVSVSHMYELRRVRWTGLAVLLAALSLSAACGGGAEGPPNGAAAAGGRGAMPPMPVEMVTLALKPVEQAGEFVGTIKSRRSMVIQPQAEGFITKILVKAGDRVAAGTPLFEIDATSQQAAVASLESMRAAREADAAFARQQAERARKLLSVGAMSQQEHDQAQTLQRTAEAQLKAVEEQIRQQRNELAYFTVTAAATGVVGDIPVRVGERVTRSTALTTVEDNTGLEVYLNVPVQEAPKLKTGLSVELLDETGAVIATERVSFISPSVDDGTQTVLVKTPLENRGSRFRTDQFVRARVVYATTPTLTVPVTAVNRIGGQYFVFVAEKGDGGMLVARQKPVLIGSVVGNDYLVTGGLSAGDQLIIAGLQKIGDGAPVQPAPPGGGRGPNGSGPAGAAPGAGKGR